MDAKEQTLRSTTVVGIRRNGRAAMASDGQVTVGATVVKAGAHKVRRLYEGRVLAGFAGSVADALALFDLAARRTTRRSSGRRFARRTPLPPACPHDARFSDPLRLALRMRRRHRPRRKRSVEGTALPQLQWVHRQCSMAAGS